MVSKCSAGVSDLWPGSPRVLSLHTLNRAKVQKQNVLFKSKAVCWEEQRGQGGSILNGRRFPLPVPQTGRPLRGGWPGRAWHPVWFTTLPSEMCCAHALLWDYRAHPLLLSIFSLGSSCSHLQKVSICSEVWRDRHLGGRGRLRAPLDAPQPWLWPREVPGAPLGGSPCLSHHVPCCNSQSAKCPSQC